MYKTISLVLLILFTVAAGSRCDKLSERTITYMKRCYTLDSDLFEGDVELQKRFGLSCYVSQSHWEIENDSLFLIKWEPSNCFTTTEAKRHFAGWYKGPLQFSPCEKKSDALFIPKTFITLDVVDGVVISPTPYKGCYVLSQNYELASDITFNKGYYHRSAAVNAKIYTALGRYERPLINLIVSLKVLGCEIPELYDDLKRVSSELADVITFNNALEVLLRGDSLAADTISSEIKNPQLAALLNWSRAGVVKREEIELHSYEVITKKDIRGLPRTREIFRLLQKEGAVGITALDIPFLLEIMGARGYSQYIIPWLYETEEFSIEEEQFSRDFLFSPAFIPCNIIDYPPIQFRNREIEKIMRSYELN